jgi:hypothetical protein
MDLAYALIILFGCIIVGGFCGFGIYTYKQGKANVN